MLNVSKNEIKMVPEGISQLEALKALILSENQIKSLANINFPKTLNTIVLSKNLLESTEGAFSGLETLEKLSLSHNQLHQWPKVAKCWELKELRLSNNKLFKIPGKVSEYPPALSMIDLGHNSIKDSAEFDGVKGLLHLSSLNYRGNPCWSEEADKEFIKAVPTLMILNSRKVRFDGIKKKKSNRTYRPSQRQ